VFKEYKRGKKTKTKSIINDPKIREYLRETLSLMGKRRSPRLFMLLLSNPDTNLLGKIEDIFNVRAPTKISVETSRRWMHACGFHPTPKRKNYYVDGHEREDVVEYRNLVFLPAFAQYESRMRHYSGENMDEVTLPVLAPGMKEIVPLFHDESTFNSNDDGNKFWSHEDMSILHNKSRGSSIMASAVICPCHGIMAIFSHGKMIYSYQLIKPGTGRDGWWTNDDLVTQTSDQFIVLFELLHPDMEALLVYDNSQNHHAMASDALVASKLKLNPGGAGVKPMRDTVWGPLNTPQCMQFEDGQPKGVRQVLLERGLWRDKRPDHKKFNLTCKHCSEIPEEHQTWGQQCCAWHVLQSQPDFQSQRTWLTETVQNSGHSVIYLPKFHCELNPIEMFWAFVKGKARAECGYSIAALDKKIPECMIACPISTIRKYVRHCLRYMDGYRKGLTGPLLDFACKKYTSHRRICEKLVDHVKELEDTKMEFTSYRKIKRENWGHVFNSFELTVVVPQNEPADVFVEEEQDSDSSDDEEEDIFEDQEDDNGFEFDYNDNDD
jgi:hypothetical protein